MKKTVIDNYGVPAIYPMNEHSQNGHKVVTKFLGWGEMDLYLV